MHARENLRGRAGSKKGGSHQVGVSDWQSRSSRKYSTSRVERNTLGIGLGDDYSGYSSIREASYGEISETDAEPGGNIRV